MSTISQFKAQMAGGGARPNQFVVTLTFPQFVQNGITALATYAGSFLCRSASLPASTLEDITTYYRGRPVHFAGERTFAPWTVQILNDNDFLVRNAMEMWSNAIANYDATNGILSPLNYQAGQMYVTQLDRNDVPVKQYTFYDVYPTAVGAIQLDFDQNNAIEMFDVEFVYNYFTTSGV